MKDMFICCLQLFGGYTMDVIASTSFGIQVDSQRNSDNPFVKNVRKLVHTDRFQSFFLLLCEFVFVSFNLYFVIRFHRKRSFLHSLSVKEFFLNI